jgi:putative oxidoreductase
MNSRSPARPPSAPDATLLIRILVGGVFVSEGIQKFLYPDSVGAGRFERTGLPFPELMAPFVGVTEIVFGALVLVGLFTRFAVIPLLVIMAVAIVTTKIPILLGREMGPFALRDVDYYGFFGMAHASRNDFAMVMGSLFLLIVGPCRFSLDARRARDQRP